MYYVTLENSCLPGPQTPLRHPTQPKVSDFDTSKRNWLLFSRAYLQSLHVALQPSGRTKGHRKQSVLVDLLDEVDKAYGQRTTKFREGVLKEWEVTRAYKVWPQTGTTQRKLMDGIFHKLCTSLHAARRHAGANYWSQEKLQTQLTAELVSLLSHLHFHRAAELMCNH